VHTCTPRLPPLLLLLAATSALLPALPRASAAAAADANAAQAAGLWGRPHLGTVAVVSPPALNPRVGCPHDAAPRRGATGIQQHTGLWKLQPIAASL
jgi:hypothetical protein